MPRVHLPSLIFALSNRAVGRSDNSHPDHNGIGRSVDLRSIPIAASRKKDDAVRTRGAGADVAIEVKVESPIKRNFIALYLNHMDFVITLGLHDSTWSEILH